MPTSNVVPGDPAELHAFATELTRFSQALESTGSALRAVDTQSGWNGPAADAFRDSFGRFTPHWFTAADAFRDAGAAVRRYADVLAWAQRQAGTAEEQLTQAAAVSRQAADLHDRSTAAGATRYRSSTPERLPARSLRPCSTTRRTNSTGPEPKLPTR